MHIKKDIFPVVKKVLDGFDPLRLLEGDAPKDEYDEESRRIAAGLRECNNISDVQRLVCNVLRDAFGDDIPEKLDLYAPIAQEIVAQVEKYQEAG